MLFSLLPYTRLLYKLKCFIKIITKRWYFSVLILKGYHHFIFSFLNNFGAVIGNANRFMLVNIENMIATVNTQFSLMASHAKKPRLIWVIAERIAINRSDACPFFQAHIKISVAGITWIRIVPNKITNVLMVCCPKRELLEILDLLEMAFHPTGRHHKPAEQQQKVQKLGEMYLSRQLML